jgi:acetyl esterase/lipase
MNTGKTLLALFLGVIPGLALATDISGVWKAEFDSQIGPQKYTYTFQQSGTNLTGDIESDVNGEKHQAKVNEGAVNGDSVTFVETMSYQGNDLRISYQGTVQGNEIHFGRQVGDVAHEDIVAKRDSAAPAAAAPAATNAVANPRSGGFGLERGPALPTGVKVERNIPYVQNGHPHQVLDLFLPESPTGRPLPLVIWIHGGAWMAGSQANPPALYLLSKGFAVASIQYRFSSDAIWPAQGNDCKAAVRFLRANAARYNLDADHFGVGGDSAGGHLAAFLGTSSGSASAEGDLGDTNVSSAVQAVVDLFGPTDLALMAKQAGPENMIQHETANSPEGLLLGGAVADKADLARAANPLTYISKTSAPFLIMHGDKDQLVPRPQSAILAKALIDAGVETTMITIHGASHEGPEFFNAQSQRVIEEFFARKLQVNAEPAVTTH